MRTPEVCRPGPALPLVLLLCALRSLAPAQSEPGITIGGTVRDSLSGLPLEHVNIFLASTTRGTGSRTDGSFVLEQVPPGAYDLIFSRVGYAVKRLHLDLRQPGTVTLQAAIAPRLIAVEEVEIAADRREWNARLARFASLFLGQSRNADQCRLINPEVLSFRMETGTLAASTEQMLMVENRALGYRLHLVLGQFRWDLERDHGQFLLYARFEPLQASPRDQLVRWEEARRATYQNSLRHFLSVLVDRRLEQEGFRLFSGSLEDLQQRLGRDLLPARLALGPASDTLFTRWSCEGWIRVEQPIPGGVATSFLKLDQGAVDIDPAGVPRDPLGLSVLGYWKGYRVADLLPNDYRPGSR